MAVGEELWVGPSNRFSGFVLPSPQRRGWRAAWPAAVFALSFAPMLFLHGRELWSRPHYQFFPALLPGAVLLARKRCGRLGPLLPGDPWTFALLAIGVWWCLAASVLFVSPWLGAVAALAGLVTAAYALGGWRLVRAFFPAWAFLFLAIPPPRHVDEVFVARLQDLVTRYSSDVLDVLRIDHVMEGNVVEITGRRLLVDQACSGIYSLLTLVAATLFFALWVRMPKLRAVILLASSVFWVVAGNVARIVAVVVLSARFKIDVASGWPHELLGLVGFAGMVAMVVSTNHLLRFNESLARLVRFRVYGTRRKFVRARLKTRLFRPDRVARERTKRRPKRSSRSGKGRSPSAQPVRDSGGPVMDQFLHDGDPIRTSLPSLGRTWLGSPLTGLAFGFLLLPQAILPGVSWNDVLTERNLYERAFGALGAGAMPNQVGDVVRIGFRTETREMDSNWGEFSRTWIYRGESGGVYASLDYTFVEWHDLALCYTGQGWRVTKTRPTTDPDGLTTVALDLIHHDGRHGHVLYGLFDRQGASLTPPRLRDTSQILAERLAAWGLGASASRATSAMTYQLQVFLERGLPVKPEEKQTARVIFDRARGVVRDAPVGAQGVSR